MSDVQTVIEPLHAARQQAFARSLEESGFAAAVVMQRRDLFYLAGTSQPCNLLIVPGHEPVLLARRVLDWIRSEASVARVEPGGDLPTAARILRELGVRDGRLGLELDVLPAKLYRKARESFPGFDLEDCSPLLLSQRMVKDELELRLLREAVSLFEAVHATVLDFLRPGITEIELSAEIIRSLRRAGHDGLVFYRRWDADLQPEGLVASGEVASRISGHAMTVTGVGLAPSLPWGASWRTIQKGDVVVVDLGLNKAGYHGDMSRSYVAGEASEETSARFEILLRCQDAAIAALGPGAPAADAYAAARRVAEAAGVEEYFQGFGAEKGHYIGHGVGVELDDPPVLEAGSKVTLEAGMVLAVEPKLIGPFGALQTEDTLVLTPDGPELMGTVPRTLFEVST